MHISIRDFLRIESLSLDLQAPINIIVGDNEAGKSSIRDALRWCLTGEARGLKTHQQQAALIRHGGKAAEVKVTLSDGSEVFRKKTPKTNASVVGKVPEDAVMTAIQCDPMSFLSLPDDKRREVLFRLIPGLNPHPEEIYKRLQKWPSPDFPEEYFPKINEAIGQLSKLAASKGFKDAENEAVTRRRIAKRLREERKVEEPKEEATIGDKIYVLPDMQEAELQEGLAKLQAKRDKLLQNKGVANGELGKLPDLEKELAALEDNPVAAPNPGEIKNLQSALEASRPILADLQKQVDALSTARAPKFYPSVCPVFPGSEISCPKAGEMAILGQKAASADKIEKLHADLKAQEEKVARLEEDLQKAKTKQKAYEDYPQKRLNLAANVARLKEKAKAMAELGREIAVLDARMQIGRDLLEAVRTFWRQKNEVDAAKAKLAKADKEAILYDTLAKALAPEGIPSRLVAEALKPMNDLLQTAAALLFPGRTLELNKDLDIELSGSPYVTLSKSAKFRVGVAFQYALAKMAKARLLLIDEADILDPQNRGQLINFLLKIQPDFDYILVFATSDHADPSPVPEIQVWCLENGKISPVSQQKAA
jgi:DNA repair exonuclease SbcCD ATPase subunit